MRKLFLGLGLLLLLSTFVYSNLYPAYSYRYRLVISIEAEGKLHTGSSVIDVRWLSRPRIIYDNGPYRIEAVGQGAIIDLGNRGAVVATLHPALPFHEGDFNRYAQWLAGRSFLGPSSNDPALFAGLSGRMDLKPEFMPGLLYFSNIKDPATARKISFVAFPTVIEPKARLVDAYIEITKAPLSFDLEKKLPWLDSLDAQKNRAPDSLLLTPGMFVRADDGLLYKLRRLMQLRS